jgi:hypothetical protein
MSRLGKLVHACIALGILDHLREHKLLDTQTQKGFLQYISGCADHITVLSAAIQEARKKRRDIRIMQVDLKAAFTTVPHALIMETLQRFGIHAGIQQYIARLYGNTRLYVKTGEFCTDDVKVERGVLQGDTLSPLLFIMSFAPVLEKLKQTAMESSKGSHTKARAYVLGERAGDRSLLHTLAYADDLTIITSNETDMYLQTEGMQQMVQNLGMTVNVKKCRYLALKQGQLFDEEMTIAGWPCPNASTEGSKFLGMELTYLTQPKKILAFLAEKLEGQLQKLSTSGHDLAVQIFALEKIIMPRLRWYFSIYRLSQKKVWTLQAQVNRALKLWMGLNKATSPKAVTSPLAMGTGDIVQLWREVKAKAYAHTTRSEDPLVHASAVSDWRNAPPEHKRTVEEVLGKLTPAERELLDNSKQPFWSKKAADTKQVEVAMKKGAMRAHIEEERRERRSLMKAGAWWRAISEGMREQMHQHYKAAIWGMKPTTIGWLAEAISDSLPTAANVGLWRGAAGKRFCPWCERRPQTLKHVLSCCSSALDQGRYTWRHNKVLEIIRDGLVKANGDSHVWADLPPDTRESMPKYIGDHIMSYRPDLSVETARDVFIVELTVPFEDGLEAAHERKIKKYRTLPTLYRRAAGKPVSLICVEVGARGMLNTSWVQLDKLLGSHKKETRCAVTQAAIACSQVLFYKRNEKEWLAPVEVDSL